MSQAKYEDETALSKRELGYFHYHGTSIEIEPEDPDGDMIDIELGLFFRVQPAEPDVGIMSEYVDEWHYALPDGGVPPEAAWREIQKIGARDEDRKPISKGMDAWHERNLERAVDQ